VPVGLYEYSYFLRRPLNLYDFPSSPPWSVHIVVCRPCRDGWNFLRMLSTSCMGGRLVELRNSHLYLVVLSITMRYERKSSILVVRRP